MEAGGQQSPRIELESARQPLSVNVVSREFNVVLVPENDLDSLAEGGAIGAIALAAFGVFAGAAISIGTTLLAAELPEPVRAAFIWAFAGSMVVSLLLLFIVIIMRVSLGAKIRAIKSGKRLPLSSLRQSL